VEGQAQGVSSGVNRAYGGMTPEQFVFWLKGFFEALPPPRGREDMLIFEHLQRVSTAPAPALPPASALAAHLASKPCGCGGSNTNR
jgi:hypothetical protein